MEADKSLALRVPHTSAPLTIDCSNSERVWNDVPRFRLSKKALPATTTDHKPPAVLDARNPVAAIVLLSDPTKPVVNLPAAIESRLDSFHAEYRFQWDENRLYGYIDIREKSRESGHPLIPEKTFRDSPSQAASSDLFYSTVVVDIGAPSWQGWTTEMHAHVRSPDAKPMKAMFYGRTNDEESFKQIGGEGVACPTDGGWIAKFAVAWLPYGEWQPKAGATANIRILVPLAHLQEGYVMGTVLPFVLTR